MLCHGSINFKSKNPGRCDRFRTRRGFVFMVRQFQAAAICICCKFVTAINV